MRNIERPRPAARVGLVALAALAFGLGALDAPGTAEAFCGFYVAGGDQKMFNDATQVVLMRHGTRTVLAMQNTYQGPPEAFALIIPVPTVLQEGDVKTLPPDVFAHVEAMGAPRLVEYWEQDPCPRPELAADPAMRPTDQAAPTTTAVAAPSRPDLGVTIEAKFTVGEYNIVILSAKDSTGLDTWLKQEKYKIPDGAEPLLRPYVESGMKFFVAKVDPAKVKFTNVGPVGSATDRRAALSPLRFHYDSDEFALPIRLGLANSSGAQDLIVNILAPNQRYEVANYPNVTIPTNLDVTPAMKDRFAAFYTALFDRTVEKHPGAVVTEYAWQATTCDPCPGPALDQADFLTLGADVVGGAPGKPAAYASSDFVLTRLHARYGREISDDLRFKAAAPLVGGREQLQSNGRLEVGARTDSINNFQGRYAIRYGWTGPITCDQPVRGVWGGPPPALGIAYQGPRPALGIAFAPRDAVVLASAVKHDIPEIDIRAGALEDKAPSGGSGSAVAATTTEPKPEAKTGAPSNKSGCGCGASSRNDVLGGTLVVGLSMLARGRRRRQRARSREHS
ncbi:MAG: DUF2330 domain-containing protein [Deltaproteobacteria bacterium]|nr:DUF2330 domain-containing protein [Deltaproteobacteria bacterium]